MRIAHLHLPGIVSYGHASHLQTILVNRLLRYKASQLPSNTSHANNNTTGNGTTTSNDTTTTTQNEIPDPVILTAEFQPIYTSGRRERGLISPSQQLYLRDEGRAEFAETMRGGQITFHGPGQMVAYPIFDLKYHFNQSHPRLSPSSAPSRSRFGTTPISTPSSFEQQQQEQEKHERIPTASSRGFGPGKEIMAIRKYISLLESSLISTLDHHSISSQRLQGTPGVFTSPYHKIASVGIHLRRHVTSHGVSLNVSREPLRWLKRIVACGLEGVEGSSIQREWDGDGGLGMDGMDRIDSMKMDGMERFDPMMDRKRHEGDDITGNINKKYYEKRIPEVEEVANVFVQKFAETWNAQGGRQVEGIYRIGEKDVLDLL